MVSHRAREELSLPIRIFLILLTITTFVLVCIILSMLRDLNTQSTKLNVVLTNLASVIVIVNNISDSLPKDPITSTVNVTAADVTDTQICGYSDPCFVTIMEEVHDSINNLTYNICKRFPRKNGDACATSCVSDGKCTSYIGSTERSIPNANDRQPFCNATSPFACYGFCNNYLDCIMPNILNGIITSDPIPSNFFGAYCLENACVYVLNYYRGSGAGAYSDMYQYNIKYSWDARTTVPSGMFFDYATEFCEYIIHDRIDSNSATTQLNSSTFLNPKNNKGCFDYYLEWQAYNQAWCIYQYTCSRPNYFNSIRPYTFVPPTKKKRALAQTSCEDEMTNLYTALTLISSENNETNVTIAQLISQVSNTFTIEELLSLVQASADSQNNMNSLHYIFTQCISSVRNVNGTVFLKPRTLDGPFNNQTLDEVQNSYGFHEKIGSISFDSTYNHLLQNATSFSHLIALISVE